jgi:integrase
VAYLRAILSSALAHAVCDDELPRNVAAHVRLSPLHTATCEPLTAAEARRLLAAAHGNRHHALFELALRAGLRRGGLLGLRWSDLNLDAATLTSGRPCNATAPAGSSSCPPRAHPPTGVSLSLATRSPP